MFSQALSLYIQNEFILFLVRKGGIIVKTTGITGGGDGFPLGDLISCQQKALRGQIVSDRITGFFLEGMHEMIPAQIEMFGKKVDGDVIC